MLQVAEDKTLPVIMYTEGGGGRPGDTDVKTLNSGLNCRAFLSWASLAGKVPRISVNNGYCFAGNAALFGAADITIATQASNIGMAGPAMIEGGGLGKFSPKEIGPAQSQCQNGTIDILCDDETQAATLAKQCVAYFQGVIADYQIPDQQPLHTMLPQDRRFAYDVKPVINTLVDTDSFTELKAQFAGAVITGLARFNGNPCGIIASNCKVNGGAIDINAGEKAADFINLCSDFGIPLIILCDTPGFMVGPAHEELGAVRRLSKLFVAGAKCTSPIVGIVLRKCYGLGAQALLGGSTSRPIYTASWPTGEFGPMGLEGAVKLGFKKELSDQPNQQSRETLFNSLLEQQYEKGKAIEVASMLEIDEVIEPADTRQRIIQVLDF